MTVETKYDQRPHIAVGVIVENADGAIFLGRCPKWGYKWIVPGGHVEYGETLEETVVREIREELGVAVEKVRFITVQEQLPTDEFTGNPDKHFIFVNYAASMSDNNPSIVLNEEFTEHRFVPLEEALSAFDLNESTRQFLTTYKTQQNQ